MNNLKSIRKLIYSSKPNNNVIINHRNLTSTLGFNRYSTYTATKVPGHCWKCGIDRKSVTDLFCGSCRAIQKPHETNNYFKVFNLDVDFDLNTSELTSSYRRMQSVLHPDKFSNSSVEEKSISEEYSSLVNKAFNTLQTPLSRALHMLKLNDEYIGEDNKSDEPAFLMEIMELNEEIDEADTAEKLKELEKKNKKMLHDTASLVSKYFKENDIVRAKREIIKMKYYNSISMRVNDLLRERGIVD